MVKKEGNHWGLWRNPWEYAWISWALGEGVAQFTEQSRQDSDKQVLLFSAWLRSPSQMPFFPLKEQGQSWRTVWNYFEHIIQSPYVTEQCHAFFFSSVSVTCLCCLSVWHSIRASGQFPNYPTTNDYGVASCSGSMFNSIPKTSVRLQKIQEKNLNYSSERPFRPYTSSKQHGNSESIRAFFI